MDPSLKGRACGPVPWLRAAVRLAAAALTGCQGGRCVWAHDFAPAIDTAGCDVDCCIVVGVLNEATPATLKFTLGEAVSFVHPATRAARLRRVCRVDFDERHPGLLGLIGEDRAELSERPRMQRGPLGFAKPYPRPDPRQLLDGDTAPGALRLGHDAFTDLVVDVGGEAASLRRRFLSSRRADDVFLACNRFRRLSWRLR